MSRIRFKVCKFRKTFPSYMETISQPTGLDVLDHLIGTPHSVPTVTDYLMKEDLIRLNKIPEVSSILIERGYDPSTHIFYPRLKGVTAYRFTDGIASPTEYHNARWINTGWDILPINEVPERTNVKDNGFLDHPIYVFEPKEVIKQKYKYTKPMKERFKGHPIKFRKTLDKTMKHNIQEAMKECEGIDYRISNILGIVFRKLVWSEITIYKTFTKEDVLYFNSFPSVKEFLKAEGFDETMLAVPCFIRSDVVTGEHMNPYRVEYDNVVYLTHCCLTTEDNIKDKFWLIEANGEDENDMMIDLKRCLEV